MREFVIHSLDAIKLAVHATGVGQPILFVHGGFVEGTNWSRVASVLETRYEVWLMDRRGHGQSDGYRNGDTLLDEADDVVAVLDAIGKPSYLVGHSAGAHVAMHAARRATNVARLVLYEPPALGSADIPQVPSDIWDNPRALALFAMRDVVGQATGETPPRGYEALLDSSYGAMLLRNTHSIPDELAAYRAYHFETAEFAALSTPTLLLVGTKSPPFNRVASEQLHSVLPNSRIKLLDGQSHGAMWSAPQLFADALTEFFGQD